MKRYAGKGAFVGLLLMATAFLALGCASDGTSSYLQTQGGYYGVYGPGDYYYHHHDHDHDYRPPPPTAKPPRPQHPIELPARPLPRPAPRPAPRGR